jgi:EpsI family protein
MSPIPPLPRVHPALLAALLAVAGGLAFAEWTAVRGMMRLWANSPMYSYGYLVPVIAGVLVWSRRDRLAALPVRPAPIAGGLLLALWAVLMIGGVRSGLQLAQQVALLPGIVGAVLVLCGLAHVRVAWAGLAYLILMIPIWDGLTEPLHLRFQTLSAGIGVWLVRLVGVPAFREGVFIDLPNLKIEVARACSGINYLVAVLALGLPLAYLYLRSPWRRILLLVSAVVVAALSNGLRVALICVLAYYEVGSPLHGPFHVLHGLFVAGIGHVVLFIGLWLLSERSARDGGRAAPGPAIGSAASPLRRSLALAGGLALVFWATGAYVHTYRPERVTLSSALSNLPRELGAWTSDPFAVPSRIEWWTGADDHVARIYRTADGRQADVHVLYFEAQEQNRELVSFRVTPLHRRAASTTLAHAGGDTMRVNLAAPAADDARYALFWYDVGGRVEARPTAVKLRTMWNALLHGETSGAAVFITMPGTPGGASEPDGLRDLASQVQTALHRHLAAARTRAPLGATGRRAGLS